MTEEKENYIKAGNAAEAENIEKQKEILTKYLPQMLSEDEIKNNINNQLNELDFEELGISDHGPIPADFVNKKLRNNNGFI